MTGSDLLAACGLYCGACYHYRASFPESAHLLAPEHRGGRPLQGYTCRGCRSGQLYSHAGCAECQIRACAEEQGLLHCGECERFASPTSRCERLLAFRDDGHVHHLSIMKQLAQLKRKGAEQWLADQAERWTCACGQPFSWLERRCSRCGALVPGYER